MKHGRLPWLRPEELDEDARSLYDKIVGGRRGKGPRLFELCDEVGRLHGPFNAMLLHPEVGRPLQELGVALRYEGKLPARAREIAILIVASRWRSRFEWYAHAAMGRHVGLTEEELELLRSGKMPETLDDSERTIAGVVVELLETRDLSDSVFARASEELGHALLFEVVTLVGYYELLDLSMRVWRTPLPAAATVDELGAAADGRSSAVVPEPREEGVEEAPPQGGAAPTTAWPPGGPDGDRSRCRSPQEDLDDHAGDDDRQEERGRR